VRWRAEEGPQRAGDAPRTRSLEEWCGKGRTRSHAKMLNRVAMQSLRPKLTPAVSDRTPQMHRQAQATCESPTNLRNPEIIDMTTAWHAKRDGVVTAIGVA